LIEADLPALYQAADAAAKESQRQHLQSIIGLALTGIGGAAVSLFGINSRGAAFLAAGLFVGGLALSVLMAFRRSEASWYRARAVAESIKTATWRFMMRADPFDTTDAPAAKKVLTERLKSILSEHKDLAHDLAGVADNGLQITPLMTTVRDSPLAERREYYSRERIDEQRGWYSDKARQNKIQGRLWFTILVVLQGAAVACALLRIGYPEWTLLPTEVFAVAAASAVGWIQVKRFRELAAAYFLTAQEIGLAAVTLPTVDDEAEFSRFVSETEVAFSREHTQWIARKELP
jgi:hypothetical protein